MTTPRIPGRIGLVLAGALALGAGALLLRGAPGAGAAPADPAGEHAEHAKTGLYYDQYTPPHAERAPDPVRVTRVTRVPEGFQGTFAFDRATGRLWLVSYGPPANTKGPSRIQELDPRSGRVLAQAELPFLGELATPVFLDGVLYQAVPYESKLYRVSVDRARFGAVEGSVPLPSMRDLATPDEMHVYRFPFVNFSGAAPTADGKLLMYAEELGELITLEPRTGRVVSRVPTLQSLRGVTMVNAGGRQLVLAGADPTEAELKAQMRLFMFRSAEGIVPPSSADVRSRPTSGVLLDPASGEVLASAVSRA